MPDISIYDVSADLIRPATQEDVDQMHDGWTKGSMFRAMAKHLLTDEQVREIEAICDLSEGRFDAFDRFKAAHPKPN